MIGGLWLMHQSWFEMNDLKKRILNNATWIPLYACQEIDRCGKIGCVGYKAEFWGCGTIALSAESREKAHSLTWMNNGIGYESIPWIDENEGYFPSDVYKDSENGLRGIRLALCQSFEDPDEDDLILHQDFVLALGLKREGDVWVCPQEGYIEVAHLTRTSNGHPSLLEVRAEHLKDYLCARKMILSLATYRERIAIIKDSPCFTFAEDNVQENCRWRGYIQEIHEGGEPFGAKVSIFHLARNDIDESEDIPVMGEETDQNIDVTHCENNFSGELCYRISGEFWKQEIIEPAIRSPRIAHDEIPSPIFFIVDSEGHRESKNTLDMEGRWLWFSPSVISAILVYRGTCLQWYTAHTGSVRFLQSINIHFGVNQLGFINVYAKDIVYLPVWLQLIWAGYNLSPDGKVSSELLASQVRAEPAETQAPEDFLLKGIKLLNKKSVQKLGFQLIRETETMFSISEKCHRFRCINRDGLYSLAKDLARITADSIDVTSLKKILAPLKEEKWGSLKTLENYLGTIISLSEAKLIMAPLFAIYDLRLADAHLPKNDYKSQLDLLKIDEAKPSVWQGYQMLHMCVSAIYSIIEML